jgi:phenylacetate-CoA ligase
MVLHPSALLPRLVSAAFRAVGPRLRPSGYHGRLAAAIRARQDLQWESEEKVWERQRASLNALLAHAAQNVPYYRALAREGKLPARIERPEDMRAIPLLTKAIIRREGESLLAENFPRDSLRANATGGSSGEPLRFWSDDATLLLSNAGEAWSATVAGLGPHSAVAQYWGAGRFERSLRHDWKDKVEQLLANRLVINCFRMTQEDLWGTHRRLQRFSPDAIVGYASALVEFARFLGANGIRPKYPRRAVISAAETLDAASREVLEGTFGVQVFNRYGSRELGLVAMECDRHQGLHVDCENVFVELVPDPQQGNMQRIVVTKLHQHGMPFLRYDVEDLAQGPIAACSCGRGYPVLKRVVGRVTETVRLPGGGCLPGEIFPHLFKDCGIASYRVVQAEDYSLDVALVRTPQQTAEQDQRMRRIVAEHVGPAVRVEFRYVDHIERSATGKLLPVISRAPAVPGQTAGGQCDAR